ncbi:actin-like ATPase domain-containing protein [Rhodocollybia butyracea]|uniref:Actin-like ATPase domain-containing protein n=1 Tax=Rhodocollybia butyracea TaxID=206335 RepID=A0A9P5Q4J5_9AGAR|nr:actin-like ATPase domain-containing protein [Rhodocollybia butyracea]
MSCCGEPKDSNTENQNRNVPGRQVMNQQPQPGPVLGLPEKPGFFQSPSPPPAVHHNVYTQNAQHTSWTTHSPSPPPLNQFGTPLPGSPPPNGSFSQMSHNIARPPSTFQSGVNNPLSLSQPHMSSVQIRPENNIVAEEGNMSISIDFGTTFSGVAYGSSRISGGQIQQILSWPGSVETYRKIPTCLLYDEQGQILAWGLEAKYTTLPNTHRCEWFKLFLEPRVLRDDSAIDPRLPQLPPGKRAFDLIVDFLSCLWEYAKEQITREIGAVADLDTANIWLTVPAAWDAKGCELMREAAIHAGVVRSARGGDTQWRNRLHIITEPEAAAVHCAYLTDLHRLQPSQNFIVADAGGGTVDLAVYKIIGQMANLEIAEIAARSGANCGSLFLDLRFRELVKTLLADHPAHLDPASLAYFMHSFSETEKIDFAGPQDDENMFHFTCFNVEDPTDVTVGLVDGQLSIPGALLRREVFDPVVEQVLALIEDQLSKVDQRIDALLLVGGFSGSEYLKLRVEEQLRSRIGVIARPEDADTATLRGAARYGLARRPLVASIIAPRSYLMKVKLPAENEDWQKRPAYIRNNDAGYPICENRLQYLVQKGAIIRKGQRLNTKFCKFSQSVQDSTFVAVLYTSESEKIMRYNDEGETNELCKWTVDLSSLPNFRENANLSGGFYTEFEIGLELDSAEVRGILLYNDQEWGRVTFDFFN